MKLSDMCKAAAEASHGSVEWEVDPSELFESLAVIRGRDSWNDAEAGWLYTPLKEPVSLTSDMDFTDTYMRLDYVSHYPISLLFFYETEEDLVRSILSPGGHFNAFTTLTAAFRYGRLSPFACYYRERDGISILFDKSAQFTSERPFEHEYLERRLVWL